MDLQQKLTTHWPTFGVLSGLIFVCATFVDFIPTFDKGHGLQFWRFWGLVLKYDSNGTNGTYVLVALVALLFTAFLVAGSLILGWVGHHILLLLWTACRKATGRRRVKDRLPPAKNAVPDLIDALRAKDVEDAALDARIKVGLILALGQIGPAAKDAIPVLDSFAASPNELLRSEAQAALKKIKGG